MSIESPNTVGNTTADLNVYIMKQKMEHFCNLLSCFDCPWYESSEGLSCLKRVHRESKYCV